ncbi:hypothetical protein PASE110613_07165 [Paenibacillus sediminis]|uniref:Lipoprotein n=1 Tax=Paenibacillus sediminis TaxID=664909 RepID=A0ABS4H2G4_9BACL|nr:hypothetical protein [Paenibacillus sediminis]MBP1936567.1 hypothetical protein [Paenibacillus sediminis]
MNTRTLGEIPRRFKNHERMVIMRRILKKFSFISIFICIVVGCSSSKMISPNTLENTNRLLKDSLNNKDYALFQTYLSEPQKNKISRSQFEELTKMTTAGWGQDIYSLISFENGEMLLVNIIKDPKNNGYFKIQDIKRVPEEMKELFKKSSIED